MTELGFGSTGLGVFLCGWLRRVTDTMRKVGQMAKSGVPDRPS
jgi:hypothetical protein